MTIRTIFPSDELVMFGDGLRGFLTQNWSVPNVRAAAATDIGYDHETWSKLAELGVHGAFLPEETGGLAVGGLGLMTVMQALGRAHFQSPFLTSAVLSAALLAGGGGLALELLAGIADGSLIVTAAVTEAGGRYDLEYVATSAESRDGAFVLNGSKHGVPFAAAADHIILAARVAGHRRARDGVTLFALPRGVRGLTLRPWRTADGQQAADLVISGVRAEAAWIIGRSGEGLAALERAVDLAILAQAAEAVGHMRTLFEATLAYCKTREQFGTTIGSFQGLQHRLVDMFAACETAGARVAAALALVDGPASPIDPLDAILVKLAVDEAARLVGQEAIQMHGGMGMSDELDVGDHFKRLSLIALTFADRGKLIQRYSLLQGDTASRTEGGQ